VAILQGPVAVRHSIKKDEPIKEMLDNVVSGLTAKVLERFYGGDESKIPAIDYLGVKPVTVPSLPGVHVLRTGNEVKLTPPASLPAAEHWLQVLAGSELNWWHAIVWSEFVVQGTSYTRFSRSMSSSGLPYANYQQGRGLPVVIYVTCVSLTCNFRHVTMLFA
jgi:fatty acid synthase subunit alpha